MFISVPFLKTAVTCSVCPRRNKPPFSQLPASKSNPFLPVPSQPVQSFRPGCAHCLTSVSCCEAAAACFVTALQSLLLSEAHKHELLFFKSLLYPCVLQEKWNETQHTVLSWHLSQGLFLRLSGTEK